MSVKHGRNIVLKNTWSTASVHSLSPKKDTSKIATVDQLPAIGRAASKPPARLNLISLETARNSYVSLSNTPQHALNRDRNVHILPEQQQRGDFVHKPKDSPRVKPGFSPKPPPRADPLSFNQSRTRCGQYVHRPETLLQNFTTASQKAAGSPRRLLQPKQTVYSTLPESSGFMSVLKASEALPANPPKPQGSSIRIITRPSINKVITMRTITRFGQNRPRILCPTHRDIK